MPVIPSEFFKYFITITCFLIHHLSTSNSDYAEDAFKELEEHIKSLEVENQKLKSKI